MSDERAPRPCGTDACGISAGIHEGLTFGRGALDFYGYWSIPCDTCARDYERRHPSVKAWPFAATDRDT